MKFKDVSGLFRLKGLVYSKLEDELVKKDEELTSVNAVLITSGKAIKIEEDEEVEGF